MANPPPTWFSVLGYFEDGNLELNIEYWSLWEVFKSRQIGFHGAHFNRVLQCYLWNFSTALLWNAMQWYPGEMQCNGILGDISEVFRISNCWAPVLQLQEGDQLRKRGEANSFHLNLSQNISRNRRMSETPLFLLKKGLLGSFSLVYFLAANFYSERNWGQKAWHALGTLVGRHRWRCSHTNDEFEDILQFDITEELRDIQTFTTWQLKCINHGDWYWCSSPHEEKATKRLRHPLGTSASSPRPLSIKQ